MADKFKDMILKKFVLFTICCIAFAREDPFTPVVVPKDSIRPYYGETSVFDTAQIEFPSSARLIKKIEVTFQNIDGSLQTRSVAVRGRIDWRMPLVISQVLDKKQISQMKNSDKISKPKAQNTESKNAESKETITRESADTARAMRISGDFVENSQAQDLPSQMPQVPQKPRIVAQNPSKKAQQNTQIMVQEQDLKLDIETALSSIDSQDLAQDSPQNLQDSTQTSHQSANPRQDLSQNPATTSQQKSSKSIPYSVNGNSIFIGYKGALRRHYIMQNPYRIVLDFELNTNFHYKNSYNINTPYFKRLRYGLHTDFLRAVLELDGSYMYDLEKLNDGVKIDVK